MKKRVISVIFAIFLVSLSVLPVFAESEGASTYGRLVDNASLLSDDEYTQLKESIDSVSEKHTFDVVIVTEDSIGDSTPTEYADDFFDYKGYGEGENYDGILFLLDMENRNWAISTTGSGISCFTDAGQSAIMDEVKPYLSDDDYYEAFDTFVTKCDEYLTQAENGKPYDVNNMQKQKISVSYLLLIAVGSGAVIGILVVLIMKSKLKTVRMQPMANSYVKQGSFVLTDKADLYLYKHVTKTAKPKDNDSGSGGSSTHTGSSGRSHGGSSGGF